MYKIRGITLPQHDIYYNMAVDESLFLFAREAAFNTTLRVYQSDKAGVTLGYFQNAGLINTEYLKKNSVDHVRRITGGRAVLHGDDLTFAITGNNRSPFFNTSVSKIMKKISYILKDFFKLLRVDIDVTRDDNLKMSDRHRSPYCFSSFSKNEILVGGRKIAGYALKRSAGSFLLQGSIPLGMDDELYRGIFGFDISSREAKRFTSLNECLEKSLSLGELSGLFIEAFNAGGYKVMSGALTEDEQKMSERLLNMKYVDPDWSRNPRLFSLKEVS